PSRRQTRLVVPSWTRKMPNTTLRHSHRARSGPKCDSIGCKKDAMHSAANFGLRSTSTADEVSVSVYPRPCGYFTLTCTTSSIKKDPSDFHHGLLGRETT